MGERKYEFSFDEMSVGDYLNILRLSIDPTNKSILLKCIEMLPKFTNIDVMALPFSELNSLVRQFTQQCVEYMQGPNQ